MGKRYTKNQNLFLELVDILAGMDIAAKDRDNLDNWLQKAVIRWQFLGLDGSIDEELFKTDRAPTFEEVEQNFEKRLREMDRVRLEDVEQDVHELKKLVESLVEKQEKAEVAQKKREKEKLLNVIVKMRKCEELSASEANSVDGWIAKVTSELYST